MITRNVTPEFDKNLLTQKQLNERISPFIEVEFEKKLISIHGRNVTQKNYIPTSLWHFRSKSYRSSSQNNSPNMKAAMTKFKLKGADVNASV